MQPFHFPIAPQAGKLPTADGKRFVSVYQRGSLLLEVYAPRGSDPQKPHKQDEVYVITRGSGEFVLQGERAKFATGDALFAPAGAEHRFENFTDDLEMWVIFYGQEGGEEP